MTQNEFFNILMDGLKDFPEIKLQDIISYYIHKFTLGLSAGKTEEEIINGLGNPNLIVNKYRNENLNTTINSEFLSNDTSTHISGKVSDIINTTFTKNISIYNKSNSMDNDFRINNSFPNNQDNFCDLHNSNIPSDNVESNYTSIDLNSSNYNLSKQKYNVDTILKICIVIVALVLFSSVITGIIGCIIGILGLAISIFIASIGILVGGTFTNFIGLPNVPAFIANFPYTVIVLFSLGSISLSILLILLFYYLCKFFILTIIKIYNSLKSKGGAV
jgi:uncharacterized membrane protein